MKMVEQFKRRILDLAIRGKLVPQDPNDEPASVLLERIREEKAKLVKAGKIKKDKTPSQIVIGSDGAAYEKFEAGDFCLAQSRRGRRVEVPFDLPDGWAWTRINDIAEIQLGKMLDKKKTDGILHSYLANISVRWGSFDLGDLKQMPFVNAEAEKFALKQGDIIMCEGGVPGRCAVWREESSDIKYQKALHRIRLHEISPEYVRYYFEAIHDKMFFTTRLSGSTIHHLPRETLIQVPIPLPPLAEQKRIVARIEELFAVADTLGTAAEGLGNTARRLDRKILDLAIRGKLVPQDPDDEPASELLKRMSASSHKSPYGNGKAAPLRDEPPPPFDIPKSWKWVRLGMVLSPMTSKRPSADRFDYIDIDAIDNKKNVIRSAKTLQTKGATSRAAREVRVNDVLFSLVRPYLRNVAIVEEKHSHCIASTGFYVCRPTSALYPKFLFLLLLSSYAIQGLNGFMKGHNSPGITTGDVVNFPIPLPPLAEQKRIVARIEELRSPIKSVTM